MASRLLPKSCVLEVERKFRSLAVAKLSQTGGTPPFNSLRSLPMKTIRDTYYDKNNLLSSSGTWVRRRNGTWEAKINKGGNFTNSRFEELTGAADVAACVRSLIGVDHPETANFGLSTLADFTTTRETWVADNDFRIVLDVMDFGHTVGEVELQQVLEGTNGEVPSELQKHAAAQEMDEKITTFMQRYAWAFTPGKPTGKLTAYFEMVQV